MLNFLLSEEQQQIKLFVRKIAEEQIKPKAAFYDENGEHPKELVQLIGKSGLFKINMPQAYGGIGESVFQLCLAVEELARADAGFATIYLASYLGICPIVKFGTVEQKSKYLKLFTEGNTLFAFGMTESSAGSDMGAIKTNAKLVDESYILNGTKQFISNAGEADFYVVFAQTLKETRTPSLSVFIIEKGQDGFQFGKKENKLGIRASSTGSLNFTNCKIDKTSLLGGKEGIGNRSALKTFEETRIVVAAQALGIAQGAFEYAVSYVKQREQSGNKIAKYQGIQWMIADMTNQIEAARAFIYSAAREFDHNKRCDGAVSAQVKTFASDMAVQVTNTALELLGGYGYMKDHPMEKYLRDAKITQIYEGTNQIQRNIIASHVLKELK